MLAVADLQMTGSGGRAREEDEEEDQLGAGARTRWGPPARDERVRSRRIAFQFVVGHGPWDIHSVLQYEQQSLLGSIGVVSSKHVEGLAPAKSAPPLSSPLFFLPFSPRCWPLLSSRVPDCPVPVLF